MIELGKVSETTKGIFKLDATENFDVPDHRD